MARLPKALDRQHNKSLFVGNGWKAPVGKAIGLFEASLRGVDGTLRWMQDSTQILSGDVRSSWV